MFLDPAQAAAWFNLAAAHYQYEQIPRTIECLQQALSVDPEYENAWCALGTVFAHAEQTADAIEAYRQALRINPANVAARYNLGVVYRLTRHTPQVRYAYNSPKIWLPNRLAFLPRSPSETVPADLFFLPACTKSPAGFVLVTAAQKR